MEKDIVGWCVERLDLPVARQSRHEAGTHVLVLLWAAAGNLFLESALTACGWLGVERLPSKRGFLYRLRRWASRGELEAGLVRVNRRVLREARRRRSLPKGAVAAVDYSDTHYYGKTRRGSCCRAPEKRGTGWFHRYAALSLVVRGGRYTVAWMKVGPFTGHRKVVETLLDEAMRWTRVRLVILDRGFYTRAVRKALRSRGVKVLVAAPKWTREKRAVAQCGDRDWIALPWAFKGEAGWTLLVADNAWLRKALQDRRMDEGHSLWLTDLPVRDPLPLVRAYNRRWSIENAFQEEDRFQARTKSPDPRLRFALLFLGAVLRNLWLLLRKGWEELTTFLLKEVLRHEALTHLKLGTDVEGPALRPGSVPG